MMFSNKKEAWPAPHYTPEERVKQERIKSEFWDGVQAAWKLPVPERRAPEEPVNPIAVYVWAEFWRLFNEVPDDMRATLALQFASYAAQMTPKQLRIACESAPQDIRERYLEA